MNVDGGCLCGRVAYRGRIDPEKIAICHCTDCQVNSASAFGVVAHLLEFELTSGTLKTYVKTAESGKRRALSFCGDCGTRIHARNAEGETGMWGLRVGTCNQRREMTPKIQVWCDSRLPWISGMNELPGMPRQP